MHRRLRRYRFLLLAITLFFWVFSGRAQEITHSKLFRSQPISLGEGLSHSMVTAFAQDAYGNYWIGTKNGLNRLSGKEITTYYARKNDSTALLDNEIVFAVNDSLNRLWVSTTKGISTYDPTQDLFKPVMYDNNVLNASTYALHKDGIYLAGYDYLYKISYLGSHIVRFPIARLIQGKIRKMLPLNNQQILLVTDWGGIYSYHTRENSFTYLFGASLDYVTESATLDHNRHLWICVYDQGLYQYDFSVNPPQIKNVYTTKNSQLPTNTILSVLDEDGVLWLGTNGEGLYQMDTNNHQVTKIGTGASIIPQLYVDNYKTIWSASLRDGITAIVPTHMSLIDINQAISAIYQDSQQTIWVGTYGDGICRVDPMTHSVTPYSATSAMTISSITSFYTSGILFSTHNANTYVLDPATNNLGQFLITTQTPGLSPPPPLQSYGNDLQVISLANGDVCLLGDIAYKYHPKSGLLSGLTTPVDYVPQSFTLVKQHDSALIGYLPQALVEIRTDDFSLHTLYDNRPNDIYAATIDSQGYYWVSQSDGIKRVNAATGLTQYISIPFEGSVTALLSTPDSCIWMGGSNGVYRYQCNTGNWTLFDAFDGAVANEYQQRASLVGASGDLYFGGTLGLLHIQRDIPLAKHKDIAIQLVTTQVNGSPIQPINKAGHVPSVKLPWNYHDLTLSIAVKKPDIFTENNVRYTLTGTAKATIYQKGSHVSFNTLQAGNYLIGASYGTKNGLWTPAVPLLQVKIQAPWWKRSWMYVLYVFFFVGTATIIILYLTERKERRLEMQLKAYDQKVADDKLRFLINISHELRTPLTLIYEPVKRIIKQGGVADAVKATLLKVLSQTNLITQTINTVLDIRKLEANMQTLHITQHAINEWIEFVSERFAMEFEAKHIALQVVCEIPSTETLHFDSEKCEIILSNMLMNALKYAPEQTRILVYCIKTETNFLRISVVDQGPGIVEADVAKLFSHFYQSSPSNKGFGIGLSFAKSLTEMMQGSIGAHNNPDVGATFFFEIPLQDRADDVTAAITPAFTTHYNEYVLDSAFSCLSYSLLIVDDEPDIVQLLSNTYRNLFKSIYTAENGSQALKITKSKHPDIILSDVMMPVMDGFELCHHIKTDLEISHIPILLLTARSDTGSTSIGYKMGADSYIVKPFDSDILLDIIKNVLSNREKIKQRYAQSLYTVLPQETTFSNADEKFLLQVNDIVAQHISNSQLAGEDIARQIKISKSTLYNKIKALTGLGVSRYINNIRIEKAKTLLDEHTLNVSEVAYQVGFEDSKYFATVFRAITGFTPTQYQQRTKTS